MMKGLASLPMYKILIIHFDDEYRKHRVFQADLEETSWIACLLALYFIHMLHCALNVANVTKSTVDVRKAGRNGLCSGLIGGASHTRVRRNLRKSRVCYRPKDNVPSRAVYTQYRYADSLGENNSTTGVDDHDDYTTHVYLVATLLKVFLDSFSVGPVIQQRADGKV